jgi:hypothetical protein
LSVQRRIIVANANAAPNVDRESEFFWRERSRCSSQQKAVHHPLFVGSQNVSLGPSRAEQRKR